jgi:hypothetical protein
MPDAAAEQVRLELAVASLAGLRLAGCFPGSVRRVSLTSYQQSLLNSIDRAFEARDPRLASMFAIFTRLTGDDGPPRSERLVSGPGALQQLAGMAGNWVKASVTIPIVLVAGLMAAIIALGIATSSGRVCQSPTSRHVGQMRTTVCQPSANGLPK